MSESNEADELSDEQEEESKEVLNEFRSALELLKRGNR